TLRFNYRGVGGSDGPDAGATELAAFWRTSHSPAEGGYRADLDAAVAFLRSAIGPDLPLAVIGYRFGCQLLPGVLPPEAAAPLGLGHDDGGFAAARGPKLVVAPEGDFAADPGRLSAWVRTLPGPTRLLRPRPDGHFFRGREDWLVGVVADFLDTAGRCGG